MVHARSCWLRASVASYQCLLVKGAGARGEPLLMSVDLMSADNVYTLAHSKPLLMSVDLMSADNVYTLCTQQATVDVSRLYVC